jgi:hypothetical protein
MENSRHDLLIVACCMVPLTKTSRKLNELLDLNAAQGIKTSGKSKREIAKNVLQTSGQL